MGLQELSDEELIKLYRQGSENSEEAIDIIFERYKYLVRKKARAMFIAGGDNDDLIQEGMIGLYKAVRDYNTTKQTSFATFAGVCINRHMMSAVTASNRKKNSPLNSYVSFDTPADIEGDGSVKLVEVLMPDNEQNPEYLFIDRERTQFLQDKIVSMLSAYEKNVLDMFLDGKDYIQIAKELNKTPKSVDNAIQRIRIKAGKANGCGWFIVALKYLMFCYVYCEILKTWYIDKVNWI